MTKILQVVHIEYEPKDDWYKDTPVEFENAEVKGIYDAGLMLDGEIIPPSDFEAGVVTEVHTFTKADDGKVELVHLLTKQNS